MKKNKIIVSIVGLVLVGFGVYNFTIPTKSANQLPLAAKLSVNTSVLKQQPNTERLLNINSTLDVLKVYETIDALYNDSNFTIEGNVIDAKTVVLESNIYTFATIQVVNDFVGNIGIGKNIKVIFRGGILEGSLATEYSSNLYKEKFGKDSPDPLPNKIVQKYNGLENIENGDNLIMFLQDKSAQSAGVDKYVITGAYQGRFKTKGKIIELHNELNNAQDYLNKDSFIKYLKSLKK